MEKAQLEAKSKEKKDYLEKLRVEMTAIVGQIAMLDELMKDMDKEAQKPVGEGAT